MKISFIFVFFCLQISTTEARQDSLRIAPNVRLVRDTTTRSILLGSIREFLYSYDKPLEENHLVLPADMLATSLLLDELNGIEFDKISNDSGFYKPYLTNIVHHSDSQYLVQVAYLGLRDSMPILKANVRFMALLHNGVFTFRSVLPEMTSAWKSNTIGQYTFHYKSTFDRAKAKEYQATIAFYDGKLGAQTPRTEFYCASSFDEALQLCGIDYKSDYNGISHTSLVGKNSNLIIRIDGELTNNFDKYDPHDLFHARLRLVLPAATINRPVDEGCAYLYGGSWGIPWKEILRRFKVYATNNPTANWLQYYKDTKEFEEGDKPLTIGYTINAMIIQLLEREKGFAAVKQLLQCGKREKGDAQYFAMLEKLTGIGESNFNTKVWEMLRKK
ncbi:MAG: hypothetical protein IPM69_05280 [Ignavibacteria bacterium]|nr:hypothetical protein [Ignavibacteria bacterium]